MTQEKEKKFYTGEHKPCGCPIENECDHTLCNFQKYCKDNPGALECKIFDL